MSALRPFRIDVAREVLEDLSERLVMLYWVTGMIGSSFSIYRDWALGAGSRPEAWEHRDDVPDLRRFGTLPRGGHFAAMEEPLRGANCSGCLPTALDTRRRPERSGACDR